MNMLQFCLQAIYFLLQVPQTSYFTLELVRLCGLIWPPNFLHHRISLFYAIGSFGLGCLKFIFFVDGVDNPGA